MAAHLASSVVPPCSVTVAPQPQDRTAATTLALLQHAAHVINTKYVMCSSKQI